MSFKSNQIINKAKCVDLTYEFYGLVKIGDYSIFVENLLVDEIADIKIKRANTKFAYAKVIKRYNNSILRNNFDNQELINSFAAPLAIINYNEQLIFKQNLVEYMFKRNLDYENIHNIVGNSQVWNYRNKITIFAKLNQQKIEFGLIEKNTHNLVVQSRYDLATESIQKAIYILQKAFNSFEFIKNEIHKFKKIILRCNYLNQIMLVFDLKEKIIFDGIFLTFLEQNIEDLINVSLILNKKEVNIFKTENFIDKINNIKFQISPTSFFQVNSFQVDNLYQVLIKNLNLQLTNKVLDCYCGIGTIALNVANLVKKVYGIEINREAIKCAKQNNLLNKQIKNVSFYAGDVFKVIKEQKIDFDVAIVDPPRAGLETKFIYELIKLKTKKIGYISCNINTLIRDSKIFLENNYHLIFVQPVDMFSQTPHIECVAIFVK